MPNVMPHIFDGFSYPFEPWFSNAPARWGPWNNAVVGVQCKNDMSNCMVMINSVYSRCASHSTIQITFHEILDERGCRPFWISFRTSEFDLLETSSLVLFVQHAWLYFSILV